MISRRLHEERHAVLDGGDGDRFGFREPVPADGHKPRYGPGGGSSLEALRICFFRLSAACGPLSDDPKRSAEPLHLEASP